MASMESKNSQVNRRHVGHYAGFRFGYRGQMRISPAADMASSTTAISCSGLSPNKVRASRSGCSSFPPTCVRNTGGPARRRSSPWWCSSLCYRSRPPAARPHLRRTQRRQTLQRLERTLHRKAEPAPRAGGACAKKARSTTAPAAPRRSTCGRNWCPSKRGPRMAKKSCPGRGMRESIEYPVPPVPVHHIGYPAAASAHRMSSTRQPQSFRQPRVSPAIHCPAPYPMSRRTLRTTSRSSK